jgi:hypothetical protein
MILTRASDRRLLRWQERLEFLPMSFAQVASALGRQDHCINAELVISRLANVLKRF